MSTLPVLPPPDWGMLFLIGVPASGCQRGPVSHTWRLFPTCRPWWWTGLPQPSWTWCRFIGLSGWFATGLFIPSDQPQDGIGRSRIGVHQHAAARRLFTRPPGSSERDRSSKPTSWQGGRNERCSPLVLYLLLCKTSVNLALAEWARPGKVRSGWGCRWASVRVLQACGWTSRPAGKCWRRPHFTEHRWNRGGDDQTAAEGL